MLTVTVGGTILTCSGLPRFGFSEGDLVGKDVSVLVPSPWKERHSALMRIYETTGRSDIIGKVRNIRILTKQGKQTEVSLQVRRVERESGHVYEVDMEEVDDDIELFFTVTTAGVIKRCNNAYVVVLLGYRAHELMGQLLTIFAPSLVDVQPCENMVCDAFHKDGSLIRIVVTLQEFEIPHLGKHISCRVRRLTSATPRSPGEQFVFPDIVLGAIIGKGAFGVVRIGTIKSLGAVTAVKLLPKSRLSPLDAQLVRREISVVQRLSHANICSLFQVVESPEVIGIAMEFCSGGEMKDYVACRIKLSEVESRLYYTQVISALSYMHAAGVIHRDIKAQNVLLATEEQGDWTKNQVKLVDFGLSNFWKSSDAHTTFCGTPAYAAPEMIFGEAYTGPEVDVWSAGILLFFMLTGDVPFASISKVIETQFEMPEVLSEPCRDLLLKTFVRDRKNRIDIAGIIHHSWVLQNERYVACSVVEEPETKRIKMEEVVEVIDV